MGVLSHRCELSDGFSGANKDAFAPRLAAARRDGGDMLFVLRHPLPGKLLPLGSWPSVVGIRIDRYATPRGEDSCHFYILRIHQSDEILHDLVDAILMEISMVPETEEIELEALALHHLHVWNIAYDYIGEVWLTCDRTKAGEFRAVEFHPVIVLLMFVDECFENFRSVILFVDGFFVPEKCQSLFVGSLHILLVLFCAKIVRILDFSKSGSPISICRLHFRKLGSPISVWRLHFRKLGSPIDGRKFVLRNSRGLIDGRRLHFRKSREVIDARR